jgi:hypothetical protein
MFHSPTVIGAGRRHDVCQRERVLKLYDHPLGPVCRMLDTFLA